MKSGLQLAILFMVVMMANAEDFETSRKENFDERFSVAIPQLEKSKIYLVRHIEEEYLNALNNGDNKGQEWEQSLKKKLDIDFYGTGLYYRPRIESSLHKAVKSPYLAKAIQQYGFLFDIRAVFCESLGEHQYCYWVVHKLPLYNNLKKWYPGEMEFILTRASGAESAKEIIYSSDQYVQEYTDPETNETLKFDEENLSYLDNLKAWENPLSFKNSDLKNWVIIGKGDFDSGNWEYDKRRITWFEKWREWPKEAR